MGVVLLLLAVGGIVWARHNNDRAKPGNTPDKQTTGSNTNLNTPTEEEKNAARDQPSNQSIPAQTSSKKQVTPIITSADRQQVFAYVSGVIEDGGICTATWTHGQDKISASSPGFANVNYTSCKRIALDGPVNISGSWKVTVSYSSSTSAGTSQLVEVP